MKAMILAAGEGRRMRPLTDKTPKPLLTVGGRPLLEHHILNLKAAGFAELVVNASHLGDQVAAFCGDGSRWGLSITVSSEETPLETAGGIVKALPLLTSAPFLVVNGDVFTDYPFDKLRGHRMASAHAHLVLVSNPPHNAQGDFALEATGGAVSHPRVHCADETLTFSGIAVYHPAFFANLSEGKRPLKPLLDQAIEEGRLTGEHFQGTWTDVGTPERLAALNHQFVTQ